MQEVTISFIGAGNMASSLIGGLVASGCHPDRLWASNPSEARLRALHARFGIHTSTDNEKAIALADVVVLSVKPGVCRQVCTALHAPIQATRPLVVSIAAGVTLASLAHWLGETVPIVRCMPNTPALVGAGASALYANPVVDAAMRDLAESILRAVGITLWVDAEAQLEIVTALSGSGPAYFFRVMEALIHGAKALGLSEKQATLLTLQTALGAAKIALESNEDPATLRQRVTSPGGTTEAAISVLETADIDKLFEEALSAAHARAKALSTPPFRTVSR